jgi:P-type conjugative transfer protein TrbG
MKKEIRMAGLIVAAVATPVMAQQDVPALAVNQSQAVQTQASQLQPENLPPVPLMSNARVRLDAKETHGVRLANEWKQRPDKPRQAADGSVKYLYGATLPTLVCTPLQVCSIQLQAGEVVNDLHTGDKQRWRITPATSGKGEYKTTYVIVKPTDAGLTTNLILTTDRRLYTIKLVSTQHEWIPVLSFDYADDVDRAWADYRAEQARQVNATTLPTGENLAALDFNFELDGDEPSWRPTRVYTDGQKTYIQFASTNFGGEAPALVALGNDGGIFTDPSEQLVNYRVIGDRYVIDKVLDRAALITGVGGDQVKVTITRGH